MTTAARASTGKIPDVGALGQWAIIGFGEVGEVLVADDLLGSLHPWVVLPEGRPPSKTTEDRLIRAGRTAVRDAAVLCNADVVVSAVTPAAAVEVARCAAPFLAKGALYVDVNSISGDAARQVGQFVAHSSARFVDAAFMGAVPLLRSRVPLYLAGPDATEFARWIAPLGLRTTVISQRVGDASAVKMLWSVMSKGVIALVAETLTAAERAGLARPLITLLREEFGRTGSPEMILRMLESTARSGERRLEEMSAVRSTLKEIGAPTIMVDATIEWISMLSTLEGARGQRDLAAVLAVLSRDVPRAQR